MKGSFFNMEILAGQPTKYEILTDPIPLSKGVKVGEISSMESIMAIVAKSLTDNSVHIVNVADITHLIANDVDAPIRV